MWAPNAELKLLARYLICSLLQCWPTVLPFSDVQFSSVSLRTHGNCTVSFRWTGPLVCVPTLSCLFRPESSPLTRLLLPLPSSLPLTPESASHFPNTDLRCTASVHCFGRTFPNPCWPDCCHCSPRQLSLPRPPLGLMGVPSQHPCVPQDPLLCQDVLSGWLPGCLCRLLLPGLVLLPTTHAPSLPKLQASTSSPAL